MTLAPCRECGKQVSNEAAACPHCGVSLPVAKPTKNQNLPLLLALLVVGIAVGGYVVAQNQTKASPETFTDSDLSEILRSNQGPISSFEILETSYYGKYDILWVVGQVKNTGSRAAGVELEATAYGADGRVIDTAKFWPASISNIPPGSVQPIKYGLDNRPGIERVTVRVVDSRVW